MSAATAAIHCQHCGISFVPRQAEALFCCSGCHFVHDLIQGEGFADFYQLLGKKSLNPLNEQPTTPVQFDWLKDASEGKSEMVLHVGNLTCTACVWLIERLFRKQKGALRLAVDVNRGAVSIWWDPESFDPVAFAAELHRFGYPVSEKELTEEDIETITHSESRALLTRLGVTFGLALNTMAFTLPSYLGLEFSDSLAGLFRLVSFASATLAMAVGGSYFFQRAGNALRAGILHLDIPISIGLIVAFLGSVGGLLAGIESLMYFDFVATFSALMLAGRWLHIRLIEKNRRDLRAREKQIMHLKRRNSSGELEAVKPADIEVGDEIEVAPDSLIPVRGNLVSPDSSVISGDWINGEPEPLQCSKGQGIPAGSRNASGSSLCLLAQTSFSGSLIEKLMQATPEPSGETGGHPRVLAIYLYSVLVVALLGACAWFYRTGDIVLTLQVLISVLVVSCPCALGLALPLVDEILNSRMRRHGVFVRSGEIWRKLPRIKSLILDKTGTLTELVPKLKNPEVLAGISGNDLAALASLVNANHHPHSAAIREALIQGPGPRSLEGLDHFLVEDFPGKGMRVHREQTEWRLGKSSWASTDNTSPETVFTKNGDRMASFEFAETIREGAGNEIAALHREGYETEILSGDPDRARVIKIGNQLGISPTHIYSSYSPNQKAEHIASGDPKTTLFIGDGGNDSLALDAAGCSGSPATGIRAIESKTDFVFVGRSFQAVRRLFHAARRRRRVVLMVFLVAVIYNLAAVGLCLAGLMNPLLAAVLMPLSSIVTTAMATRA